MPLLTRWFSVCRTQNTGTYFGCGVHTFLHYDSPLIHTLIALVLNLHRPGTGCIEYGNTPLDLTLTQPLFPIEIVANLLFVT